MGRKARLDLVLDCANPEELAQFWRRALGYRVFFSAESVAVLVPDEGNASPLVLQRVPEPKAGKNRMHLDIRLEPGDDPDAVAQGIADRGGRELHFGWGDLPWRHFADPSGNEFCVLPSRD